MSYDTRDIFGCSFHRGNCERSDKDRNCFARNVRQPREQPNIRRGTTLASSEKLSEPKPNDKLSALRNLSAEIVNDREFPKAHSLPRPSCSDVRPTMPAIEEDVPRARPSSQCQPFVSGGTDALVDQCSEGPSGTQSPITNAIASEGLPAQPRLPSEHEVRTPRKETLSIALEDRHLASPSAYEMGQIVKRCEEEKTWCTNHVTSDSSLKVTAPGDPSATGHPRTPSETKRAWDEVPPRTPNAQTIRSADSHNAGSIDVLLAAVQSLEEKILHQLRDVSNATAMMLKVEMKHFENDVLETLQTAQKYHFQSAAGFVEEKNEERKNGLDEGSSRISGSQEFPCSASPCADPKLEDIVEVEPTSMRQRDFSVTKVGRPPNITNMPKPSQTNLDANEDRNRQEEFSNCRGSQNSPQLDELDFACRRSQAHLAAKILGKSQTSELGMGMLELLGELSTPGVDLDGVEKLYKTTGWAQAMVRSTNFQHLVFLVICANAVYLGVDCVIDNPSNLYEGPWSMIVVSNLLSLFFCFEWVTRFCAFESTSSCLLDAWFKFDSVVVFFMIAETWLMAPLIMASGTDVEVGAVGLLRLLKVLRLARMTAFAHSVPELVTILKGIYCATRSVASTMLLNLLLMYTFSIAIFSFLRHEHALNEDLATELFFSFGSLSDSLLGLANIIFMLDGTGFVLCKLMYAGNFNAVCSAVLLWIFLLIAAVAIMGMLMGVFVDVVQSIASNERDRFDTIVIKETILQELMRQDDGDGNIDKRELQKILNDDKSRYIFQRLKVNRLFLIEMQDLYFPSDGTLIPIATVVEMMLMSRGDNPVDVQLLSCGLAHVHQEISTLRQVMLTMLDR